MKHNQIILLNLITAIFLLTTACRFPTGFFGQSTETIAETTLSPTATSINSKIQPTPTTAPSAQSALEETKPSSTPQLANEEKTGKLTSDNFRIGVGIKKQISSAQTEFINRNFAYVMTPFLSTEVRTAFSEPHLILYRSIQGTWEGFSHFDWEHIDAHENMFLHHNGERILTIWNSWLMNPNDLVSPDDKDALDHWINYYAVTASQQVLQYQYDGLFIDSASHALHPGAVRRKMPDDYDKETWYQGRVASLAFIKSYLPDKIVVFNGLHSQTGEETSLANTDGGMWETFAFRPGTGEYQGEENWQAAIEMTARNNDTKLINLVVKEQPNLFEDIQKRVFSVASYLLVSNSNTIFSMTDKGHIQTKGIPYFPEYKINLGHSLGEYTIEDNLYLREFENGIVLVNPSAGKAVSYKLDQEYRRVIPVGGGEVAPNGDWQGSLSYEAISGTIELPPVSALILLLP